MASSVTKKTEVKKTEEKKVEAAPVEKEAETAETVKEEKAAEEAAPAKKTVRKKAAATKKTTTAKTKVADEKTTEKKTVTRKTTRTAKAAEPKFVLQYQHVEIDEDALVAKFKEQWEAMGNSEKDIKEITVYLKPEEFSAYFVVNGVDTVQIYL